MGCSSCSAVLPMPGPEAANRASRSALSASASRTVAKLRICSQHHTECCPVRRAAGSCSATAATGRPANISCTRRADRAVLWPTASAYGANSWAVSSAQQMALSWLSRLDPVSVEERKTDNASGESCESLVFGANQRHALHCPHAATTTFDSPSVSAGPVSQNRMNSSSQLVMRRGGAAWLASWL